MRYTMLHAGVLTAGMLAMFGSVYAQLGSESVTVATPNGGECFIPGSQVNVTWQAPGVDHVAIGSRTDANPPPSWQQDFQAWDAHPVFGTTFRWTVPNITSNSVKLWVEGHNGSHAKLALDSSNNSFTVSNTCGVDEPPSTTAPQVTQILVGSAVFQTTDPIEVEKGKNLTLVGTAGSNEVVTIFVTNPEKKLTTTAAADGKWTFEVFTRDLAEGTHQVDLETAGSPRSRAFSFTVIPVGQAPSTPPPPPSTPTPSVPTPSEGSLQRTARELPYLPLALTAGVALVVGFVTYVLLKRRGKRIDETPIEPPQIT